MRLRWPVVVLVVGAGLLGALWIRAHTGPVPRQPAGFDALDPLVRARVEEERSAVSSRRRSDDAWLRLGMVEEANGLFGDAELCYVRALELAGDEPKTLHRLACTRERLGDLPGAADTMERAARAGPEVAASWWWLAWWRLDLGELEAAEQALAEASRRAPAASSVLLGSVRLALARGEPARARALLEQGGLLSGEVGPYAHVLLAQALRQLGELDGAEAATRNADGRRPTFLDPWAVELQALETGYAALRLRAGRDLQARRFAAAEPKLREVLAQDPADARAWNMLAVCRLEQGDAAGALQHLAHVFELEPESRDGAINQARALLRLEPRDPVRLGDATARLQQVLGAREGDSALWRALAALADARGLPDETLAALDRVATIEPEATDVRLQAAYAELKAKRFERALERFQALQDAHPELTEAWFGAATTLVQARRPEEARALCEHLAGRPDADPGRLARLREALASAR